MSLPILDFLVERMEEFDENFEHRVGTPFSDLFMQPLSLIMQPLRDEANDIYTNQSLKRILDLDDPNLYPEESVDDLVSNLFVFRRTGAKSSGIVRMYFIAPKALSFLEGTLEFTNSDGLKYFNISAVTITEQEMNNNTELEFYFFDVAIEAENEGDAYEADIDGIVATSESDAVRVFNEFAISGGIDRETNTELITRTQKSIGVRDLNTGKGFNAIMFETFLNKISELQPIGFGDPEMMRDIVFNFHIGGRIDGWVKTPTIQDGFFNAFGLSIDFTRRLSATRNLEMNLTSDSLFGIQNIDVTDNPVKAFNIEALEQAAVFYSSVDLEAGIDLSINQFISVALDSGELTNVKISGALPEVTRAGEIVNRINVALTQTVCTVAVNPIVVSRRRTGAVPNASDILFDPTSRVFANLVPGDILSVTIGTNAGIYIIQNVISENELQFTTSFPFVENEVNYKISRTGTFIKLLSPTKSIDSKVILGSPLIGTDALLEAIGLASAIDPYEYNGRGRYEYVEGVNFEIDILAGTARRIIGPVIVADTSSGFTSNSIFFEDSSIDIFLNIEEGDMLTITNVTDDSYERDYRVLEKINNQKLRLDTFIPFSEGTVSYRINRTGIKDKEFVLYEFDYNPLAIDVGNQVQLDELGRERGIREGREDSTITEMAFLWITVIELIDPISGEPTGVILDGLGGYGQGGYGKGGYGIGSKAQYALKVNVPEHRFSAYEDSLITIDTAFLGQSFRVSYKHVPEIIEFHAFANSDEERVLDADIMMKHFIPAVVNIELEYTTDPTNPLTKTEDELKEDLAKFINTKAAGTALDASDLVQVIIAGIDQSSNKNAKVHIPIKMKATIYNTDGSRSIINSEDSLEVPNETIPPYSAKPLSARTSHWISGEITLTVNNPSGSGVF